jgi:hypothetical protein
VSELDDLRGSADARGWVGLRVVHDGTEDAKGLSRVTLCAPLEGRLLDGGSLLRVGREGGEGFLRHDQITT